MVSRPSLALRGLQHQPVRLASRSRFSIAGTLTILLLILLTACIPLAAAEGGPDDPSGPVQGIVCQSPNIYSINVEDDAGPLGTVMPIRATVTGCQNCYYTWTIITYNCTELLKESHEPIFNYQFPGPGVYQIGLSVWEQAEQCTGESPSAVLTKQVRVRGAATGAQGVCCKPNPQNLVITQNSQTTDLGSPNPVGYFESYLWDCPDCVYSWSVKRSNSNTGLWDEIPLTSTNSGLQANSQLLAYIFTEPGIYGVTVKAENPPACMYDSRSRDSASASVQHAATGVAPNCADAGTVSIYQVYEFTQAGSTVVPYWTAERTPLCLDCVYSWSIYKMTDTFEPVPLDRTDIYNNQGIPALRHKFSEPGDYKIYLRVETPSVCQYTGTDRPYAPASVIHHVTSSGSYVPQYAPGDVNPIQTTAPQPSATSTVIPAGTQTAGIIPQETLRSGQQPGAYPTARSTTQPAGTPAPARTGTDGQTAGAAPTVTTASPGGSDAGAPAAAASPATTTRRTPGFALAVTLCAGLLMIVLRRK